MGGSEDQLHADIKKGKRSIKIPKWGKEAMN